MATHEAPAPGSASESRARFTLSFDLELAWGEFYRGAVGVERLLAARAALPELLRVLERHEVAATFAVVGHLLLDGCDGHPGHPRPALGWGPRDWLGADPRTSEKRDPCWYAPSLVRLIASAAPGHEIGAHGFTHVPLDEPGVSIAVARAEAQAAAEALRAAGHPGRAFVFPRNGIAHLDALANEGFRCYRGVEPRWYRNAPKLVRKVSHMLDQLLAITPPVGAVRRRGSLQELPSSMLFLSREGFRRRVPMSSRVRRAQSGLRRAIATGQVFHLWMHVEDLVPDTPQMLAGLEAVLAEVATLRAAGGIQVRRMSDLAHEAEPQPEEPR